MMLTKRIMPLVLILALFLTACGGEVAKDDGGNRNEEGLTSDDRESGSGETSASGHWGDWVKDVPDGEFEQAGSESFVHENNGYSIELTLDRWLPTRGSSEYVLHPASDEIPLPLLKSSDCIIPFAITTKTTTADSSFMTEYYISVEARKYNATYDVWDYDESSYFPYICSLSRFEDTIARGTEQIDKIDSIKDNEEQVQKTVLQWHKKVWEQYYHQRYYDTKPGDEQVILGCYVIKDFYSPEFPNGNLELFPNDSALMRITVNADADTGQLRNKEEFDMIMN